MNSFKASNGSLPPLIRFLSSHGRRASPCPGILGVFTPRSRRFSGPSSNTFMEVVKTVLMQASATNERVAIRVEQKSYGYLQLGASVLNVSNLLHNKDVKGTNGMRYLDGARVGIVAKPSAEFVSGILGTWLCGGVAVPLALSYPEAELFHVMNDSDISMILSTQEHQQLLENVAAKCSAHLSLIPAVTSMEQSGSAADNMVAKLIGEIEDSRIAEGDDPALILYTSGTTGKPKGVVHTYKSIISQWNENCERLNGFTNCVKKDLPCDVTPVFGLLSGPNSDRDVHGLFNALLAPLYAGAVVEFMPKFSVHGVWQRWQESYPKDGSIADDAITLFTGVPTMYTRLLQGYEKMDLDLQVASASAASKLRLMMCGSSALPYPVLKQWEEITGHRLLERYGMTEFFMALSNPLHGIRKGGTVGKALPRVEVKIIPEDGSATGTTEVGELCVRSPSLFKEYWKQPKITKESFIDGGFFKTGDTVTVDEDGYYIILGRTNADIMKVGGYKLSALEIEAVLLEHEVVSECCILGLHDKAYGEVVCAIIVPQPDARRRSEQELKPAISLEELQNWSKEKLAPYKIPTKLFLWDSLPRNAMGKVNKKALKKLLEGQ